MQNGLMLITKAWCIGKSVHLGAGKVGFYYRSAHTKDFKSSIRSFSPGARRYQQCEGLSVCVLLVLYVLLQRSIIHDSYLQWIANYDEWPTQCVPRTHCPVSLLELLFLVRVKFRSHVYFI